MITTILFVLYAFGVGYVTAAFKRDSSADPSARLTAAAFVFATAWPLFFAHALVEKARARAMKPRALSPDPQDPEYWEGKPETTAKVQPDPQKVA